MKHSRIAGTGRCLPKRIVTNDELAQTIETSDEWIRERTGIAQRHVAGEGETTLTLCEGAARNAMEAAGVGPGDIDLIVTNPPLGSRVQIDAAGLLVAALPNFARTLAPDFGPAAPVVLGMRPREQLAQPQVAGAIPAEHRRAVRGITVALVAEPEVATDDRLHAHRPRRFVELDRAEEVGGVRDRERGHAVGRGRGHRVVHACHAVHDRIFRVQAKVDEARRGHGARVKL